MLKSSLQTARRKNGTRTPGTLEVGTRIPSQRTKVGLGTPLKCKSETLESPQSVKVGLHIFRKRSFIERLRRLFSFNFFYSQKETQNGT